MEFVEILRMSVEMIGLLLGVLLISYVHRVWKKNRNPIDLAVNLLIIFLLAISLVEIGVEHAGSRNYDFLEIMSIGYLNIRDIFYISFAVLFGWFIIYVFDFKKLFTFPITAGFFVGAYLYLTNDRIPHYLFFTIIVVSSAIILLINSIRNRHGTSFSIFIVTLMSLPKMGIDLPLFTMLYPYVMVLILYLGINGWFDEKIFYDREKKEEIKNTWISRAVK